MDEHIFTLKIGFLRVVNGMGCGEEIQEIWPNIRNIGMSPSGFIHVRNNKKFIASLLIDIGSDQYYGAVIVETELPDPKPLRGPSYISAIGAEAARLLIDMYKNVTIEGEREETILKYKDKSVGLKELCKIWDERVVPSAIRLKDIRSGTEVVCSTPIYVNMEDVIDDLPKVGAGSVRGTSNVLKPLCYSDPFTVVIAESSLGTTLIAIGGEEGMGIGEEIFL
ncbi:hypothetical protein EYM_00810 [Ignicoccus islandicus DSM 13165]|uniref:Uncharacterized protein n=1 Tax=Ignicoccus islandicus DSM 13165 TaxID=940295 RepID=A0A0U2WMG6_9CREN|nr:hypothetical protein [Ignicoccus islandicus]ALU12145.1 hypothetical protein EYM_00810 [Ignicoccus islandicus DSM 13165]